MTAKLVGKNGTDCACFPPPPVAGLSTQMSSRCSGECTAALIVSTGGSVAPSASTRRARRGAYCLQAMQTTLVVTSRVMDECRMVGKSLAMGASFDSAWRRRTTSAVDHGLGGGAGPPDEQTDLARVDELERMDRRRS